MKLEEKVIKASEFVYSSLEKLEKRDIDEKEKIGAEIMALNALTNAYKALKEND